MFQISFTLTFEDSTVNECLVDILQAYQDLGRLIREIHPHVLLAAVACPGNDKNARVRLRAIMDHSGTPVADRVRSRDILTLAALERGETARFDGDITPSDGAG